MSTILVRGITITTLLTIFGVLSASGQLRLSSSLRGTITDKNSSAVPGASLTLTNERTGAERTTTSNDAGEYQFEQLQPDSYRLRIERTGFKTIVRSDIQLSVATGSTLDIVLDVVKLAKRY